MPDFILDILSLFGFTKHQQFIAVVCMVILLSNLFGGLMRSIVLASGGPFKPRPLTETMAFRLILVSELALILFAFYYHSMLISYVEVTHVIYWVFTLISSPVLAYIGSQITYLVLQKKIEANRRAYLMWQKRLREKRKAQQEEAKRPKKRPQRSFKPHS